MKNAKPLPLIILRKTVGMSQPQFAAALGLGVDYIKSVECGRAAVSENLAESCSLKFGVLPSDLKEPHGWPRTIRGEEYTIDFYREYTKGLPSDQDGEWEEKAGVMIADLIAASGGRSHFVARSFQKWHDSIVESLNMKSSLSRTQMERDRSQLETAPLFSIRHGQPIFVGQKTAAGFAVREGSGLDRATKILAAAGAKESEKPKVKRRKKSE